MLIACPSCHRQYDVAHLDVGEKTRCLCGDLFAVPEPRTRVARIQHCSSCGGHVEENSPRCGYCGGSISLEERNLGASCPECYARLTKDARFCMDCGVKIDPTTIQAKRLTSACPRCASTLSHCTVPQGQYTECGSCGGLWLEQKFFDQLIEARDTSALGKQHPASDATNPGEPQRHDTKYLPCPACGELMNRKNFGGGSGVIIDWCKPHGFWFDNHELQKIIRFVAAGGLDKTRQRELERAREELSRTREQAQRAQHRTTSRGALGLGSDPSIDIALDGVLELVAAGLRRLFRI